MPLDWSIHDVHIIETMAGAGLVSLDLPVIICGEDDLVEVDLAVSDGDVELLELVGLCLKVAVGLLWEALIELV